MIEGLLLLETGQLKIIFEGPKKWTSAELMEDHRPKLEALASESVKPAKRASSRAPTAKPIVS